MNRRGTGDIVSGTLLYAILVVLFTIGIFMIIAQHRNNAAQWESFYAQELALLLDQAKSGDTYTIDIQKASEYAVKNGINDPSYIVQFDGKMHEVVVRLQKGRETRFSYFNDVVVRDVRVEIGGVGGNKLHFRVVAPLSEEKAVESQPSTLSDTLLCNDGKGHIFSWTWDEREYHGPRIPLNMSPGEFFATWGFRETTDIYRDSGNRVYLFKYLFTIRDKPDELDSFFLDYARVYSAAGVSINESFLRATVSSQQFLNMVKEGYLFGCDARFGIALNSEIAKEVAREGYSMGYEGVPEGLRRLESRANDIGKTLTQEGFVDGYIISRYVSIKQFGEESIILPRIPYERIPRTLGHQDDDVLLDYNDAFALWMARAR